MRVRIPSIEPLIYITGGGGAGWTSSSGIEGTGWTSVGDDQVVSFDLVGDVSICDLCIFGRCANTTPHGVCCA